MAISLKPTFTALLVQLFVVGALADHQVTFINKCPFNIQPMWKRYFDQETQGNSIATGESFQTSVPEIWDAGRFYVQDPLNTCSLPDGDHCTLLECSFGPENPRFWQCNISVITGFNLPISYKFADPNCTGPHGWACTTPDCSIQDAYRPEGCDGCLNQCNTDGVGIEITFCQDGAPVPAQFPRADPPPAPEQTTPAPPPPEPTTPAPPSPAPTSTEAPPPEPTTTEAPPPPPPSTTEAPAPEPTSTEAPAPPVPSSEPVPAPSPSGTSCAKKRDLRRSRARAL
ncbi:hypothetical protein EXIGLDRAFT_772964 [Exidia glandulosa HHB12029]|uniref:Osmotin, thaumatin-like protein n=1 Tax=Exidia glandulosa HHB12029 TaxID=1314781 RepID=A0A165F1G2_EXIGL|nr:hypothetical protein EXIGLDRAFT_772964 [Exidia glandulosa HHB12029]